jgi:hypothetical protein
MRFNPHLRTSSSLYTSKRDGHPILHDIHFISSQYKEGNRGRILQAVHKYHMFMNSNEPAKEKIEKMRNTQKAIQGFVEKAPEKAFGNKVLQKLQLDIFHKLQEFLPSALVERVQSIYEGIQDQDQLKEFNMVIQNAIVENQLTITDFEELLHSNLEDLNLNDTQRKYHEI